MIGVWVRVEVCVGVKDGVSVKDRVSVDVEIRVNNRTMNWVRLRVDRRNRNGI